MRYLANAILHRGNIYRNSIVEITPDGKVTIQPFTDEQHSTTYISGIILVARRDAVDDSLYHSLLATVRRAPLLERALQRVRAQAERHQLYASLPNDIPALVLLPRR